LGGGRTKRRDCCKKPKIGGKGKEGGKTDRGNVTEEKSRGDTKKQMGGGEESRPLVTRGCPGVQSRSQRKCMKSKGDKVGVGGKIKIVNLKLGWGGQKTISKNPRGRDSNGGRKLTGKKRKVGKEEVVARTEVQNPPHRHPKRLGRPRKKSGKGELGGNWAILFRHQGPRNQLNRGGSNPSQKLGKGRDKQQKKRDESLKNDLGTGESEKTKEPGGREREGEGGAVKERTWEHKKNWGGLQRG